MNPPSNPRPESTRRSLGLVLGAIAAAAVVAIGGLALLTTVIEHKQEAKNPFFRVVEHGFCQSRAGAQERVSAGPQVWWSPRTKGSAQAG